MQGVGVDRIEGGSGDECRVEGVPTDRLGEGVAVVWDGVEVELEGLDGGGLDGGGLVGNEQLEYTRGRVRALDGSMRIFSGFMKSLS